MRDNLDCGHPECREISERLRVIAKEQGEAAWECALLVLGYCGPPHDGESHDGTMPENAMDYIDQRTMPHTARRYRELQREAERAAREALEEEQLDEIHREMEADRRNNDMVLELWEKLTAISTQRPLTHWEKRELEHCESYFGGREKLLKSRASAKTPKGGYGGSTTMDRRVEIKFWLRFASANLAVALGLVMLIICGEYALHHGHDPDWVLVGFCGASALYFMVWSTYYALRQYEAMFAKYLH